MVNRQITANKPPRWSKPSAPQKGNTGLLLPRHTGFTEILTERRDGKGEQSKQRVRNNEGIKRIKNRG